MSSTSPITAWQHFVAIIAFSFASVLPWSQAIDCFSGFGGEVPSLPNNAIMSPCNTFCYKVYVASGFPDGKGSGTIAGYGFAWGCIDDLRSPQKELLTCGSTYDEIHSYDFSTIFYYNRYCTCCGELCNGVAMNDNCTDTPHFTKTCYQILEANQPELPPDAQISPCASSQSCYKASFMNESHPDSYYWGCMGISTVACIDSLSIVVGTERFKYCQCCGDLCNDASMNSITANSSSCANETSSTSSSAESTTTSTIVSTSATTQSSSADDNSSTVVIVCSVLGSLLFVSIVIIGAFAIMIYKGKGAPGRLIELAEHDVHNSKELYT